MLDRLSPARRALLFGGLAAAAVAVVVLTVAATHRGPATTTEPTDALPPVVLVPGYGGVTEGLDLMAAALSDDGREVQVVDLGTDSLGDLHEQAGIIKESVDDVLANTGATSVDVVAFSAGGIATRLWVADDGGASVARRIVTLSTPHHGTERSAIPTLGPTPCPVACRQLTAGSALMRALNEGDETPPGPDWVSIWSDDDEVVVPPTSARLTGALDFSVQSICPDVTVGHQGMASNRVVIAMVRHVLGGAAPSTPGSSVCRAPAAGSG